jgi:hypothetical protein
MQIAYQCVVCRENQVIAGVDSEDPTTRNKNSSKKLLKSLKNHTKYGLADHIWCHLHDVHNPELLHNNI